MLLGGGGGHKEEGGAQGAAFIAQFIWPHFYLADHFFKLPFSSFFLVAQTFNSKPSGVCVLKDFPFNIFHCHQF